MKNIRLISHANHIESETFNRLYLSRLSHIKNVLPYYEEIGIPATITLHGEIRNKRLVTRLTIDCSDEQFARTLKQAIRQGDSVQGTMFREAMAM